MKLLERLKASAFLRTTKIYFAGISIYYSDEAKLLGSNTSEHLTRYYTHWDDLEYHVEEIFSRGICVKWQSVWLPASRGIEKVELLANNAKVANNIVIPHGMTIGKLKDAMIKARMWSMLAGTRKKYKHQ